MITLSTFGKRSALLGATLAVSATGFAQEQFSLTNNPIVLFDGSNTGNSTGTINGMKYVVIQGHAVAQGDMVLGKVGSGGELAARTKRGLGVNKIIDRWPDGIVPYQFDENISNLSRQRSTEAMEHWSSRTGIAFIERTTENASQYSDYINFEPSAGCASWVGRVGQQQAVWVSDNCTTGSIIHEIGHAVGLFHEHTRPDRDNFITVNWDNIVNGKDFNFEVLQGGEIQLGEYDYGSIMHYGERFFTSNGSPTIVAPDNIPIGQRNALSDGDIASVDEMYQTNLSLVTDLRTGDDGVEVDIIVTNDGTMGANTLMLIATMGDNADWLSVSSNSGWECQAFGSEMRCTRNTLREQTDSRFTVLVDPKGAANEEFSARLVSNTRDTDHTDNRVNYTGPLEFPQAPSTQNEQLDENSTTENETASAPPELGQGQGTGGSGGGGAAIWLGVIALLARRWRITG